MDKKIYNICITIILCVIPLFYIPISNMQKYSFLVKEIILVITSVVLLFTYSIKGYNKPDYIDITLLVFLGFNILSTIFSENILTSLTGLQQGFRFDGLITLLCYVLIYFISKYCFKGYKGFLKILFTVALIICLISIYQFVKFNQVSVKINYTEGVAKGTIGNSNYMGSFALLFIPAILSLYIFKGKIKYLIISSIFIFTLIITTARSAWVGFLAFGILLLIFIIKNTKERKNYAKTLLIISIILIISLIGVIAIENITGNHIMTHKVKSLINDFASLKNGISDELGTARVKIWRMVIPVIKAKPLLGTGPDTLPYALAKYSPTPFLKWISESNTYVDKAHNDYLQIAACTGIPSLIVYLAFLVFVIKKNIKFIFKDEISFILIATIIAYLVQIFFNISVISVAPIFWFLLGISQNEEFIKELRRNSE